MTQSDNSPRVIAKPLVGISMGDPAGIGPETIIKSLFEKDVRNACIPIVFGDLKTLETAARSVGFEFDLAVIESDGLRDVTTSGGKYLYDLDNVPEDTPLGVISKAAGKASGEYIEKAVEFCRIGELDSLVTAPINKKSFNSAGYEYPGHTEFLAHLTGTGEVSMSFFAENLRVVLLSTHVSMADAINLVKRDSLAKLIGFTDRTLGGLLGKKVKIGVAGLNPHASEDGMFGEEEALEMMPAIQECREAGIDVSGPYSADTVFLRGYEGEFDAVIACYHDQATIAVKCLSFGKAVNVTLGLPIIRTSVDHGTAFDIAGKNMADPGSMIAAILLAAELAGLRQRTA